MSRLPDFVIIGAMKCGTSTLHDQLAQQPGFCMSDPKEPNFFSNDEQFARGLDWYASLFAGAEPDSICGESSTHYTKLPTYPDTLDRMRKHLDAPKLIYVMRHPVNRLVSHYVHEWSERTVSGSIDDAVRECSRLTDYSRYGMQLRPFLDAYGRENVLPVFFERMVAEPQSELERVCRFLGYAGQPRWQEDLTQRNVSRERLRTSAVRDAIVWNPVVTWLRRKLVPQSLRDRIKALWQMKERPQLSEESLRRLEATLDEDLAVLGEWLGADLNCGNFKATALAGPMTFSPHDDEARP